ncbi:MAG: calcium-binding protein [Clostridiales bacterium]
MKKKLIALLFVIVFIFTTSVVAIAINIQGTVNNDILEGSDEADTILGRAGDDIIYGREGNDSIFGGSGNDIIQGNQGADIIYGKGGKDTIYGNLGPDTIYGGLGADTLRGGNGKDTIYGKQGADIIYGGGGNDRVNGNLGNDIIYGKTGNDTLRGGYGADVINGNQGNDTIYGGIGNDIINGGLDNDTIVYNYSNRKKNNDTLLVDPGGNDTLNIYTTQDLQNIQSDYSGNDLVIKLDSTNTITIKNYAINNWLEKIIYNDNVAMNKPEIIYFNADSTNINIGDTLVLSWDVKNATSIQIEGFEKVQEDVLPLTGELEVWPFATTEYILTAYGKDGSSVEQSIKVNVEEVISSELPEKSIPVIIEPTVAPEKTIPIIE